MGSSKIQGRNGAKSMSGLIPAPSIVYILRNERQTKLAKKGTSKNIIKEIMKPEASSYLFSIILSNKKQVTDNFKL